MKWNLQRLLLEGIRLELLRIICNLALEVPRKMLWDPPVAIIKIPRMWVALYLFAHMKEA